MVVRPKCEQFAKNTTLLAYRHLEHARSQAPAWERAVLEALPTALNIFIGVSTNENTGRESEAPAELFAAAAQPSLACERPLAAQ